MGNGGFELHRRLDQTIQMPGQLVIMDGLGCQCAMIDQRGADLP
jgi:hypothetical protein